VSRAWQAPALLMGYGPCKPISLSERQDLCLPRPDEPHTLLGQLDRVGKDDLRLPPVIADLPCHTDALAAERSFGGAELETIISV
jgi:hypothetical protein